jgi:hypothetical protein
MGFDRLTLMALNRLCAAHPSSRTEPSDGRRRTSNYRMEITQVIEFETTACSGAGLPIFGITV